MTTILCGVDDSADARIALRAADRLARQLGARLVVAHVAPISIAATGFGPGDRLGPAALPPGAGIEGGERLLETILAEEGLEDAEARAVVGFPPDRLADLADEEGAELIVVGSRGRGAFRSALLGSVSTELIGVARSPVLVVPRGATVLPREGAARAAASAGRS